MSSISIKLYKNSILSLLSNNTNNILENDAKIIANSTFLCYTNIIKMEDTTYSVGK